jgi:hypothetical protein
LEIVRIDTCTRRLRKYFAFLASLRTLSTPSPCMICRMDAMICIATGGDTDVA